MSIVNLQDTIDSNWCNKNCFALVFGLGFLWLGIKGEFPGLGVDSRVRGMMGGGYFLFYMFLYLY